MEHPTKQSNPRRLLLSLETKKYPNYHSIENTKHHDETVMTPTASSSSLMGNDDDNNDRRRQNGILSVRRPRGAVAAAVLLMTTVVALLWISRTRPIETLSSSSARPPPLNELFGPLLVPFLDRWPISKHEQKKDIKKALQILDANMAGSVLFPYEDDFDQVAKVWKEDVGDPPRAIVLVANEADVQLAVTVLADLYRHFGTEWRIQSGGHSYGGYSTVAKGIVLSLSNLNDIGNFDATTGIVTIGPAVRVQDILDEFLDKGYGGVVGECPGVAEGGFVLGGGYGFLSRKHGLGADNIVRARVVLPDGSVVTASETDSPDLFWALRGAGQNSFGVVTQLEYQLHASQDTQLFASTDQMPLSPDLLTAIGSLYDTAPGEFMFLLEGGVSKHGTTDALITWFGADDTSLDKGEDYLRKEILSLLSKQTAASVSLDRMSWRKMTLDSGNFEGNLVRAWTGFLMKENNTEKVWNRLLDQLRKVCIGNPYLLVDIELWGGAIADKDPGDTAFYYREAVYNVGLLLLVPSKVKHADRIFDETLKQVDHAWNHEISQYLEGVYTNYIMESLSDNDYARAYWGGNLERLQQIKNLRDPENVFHHPQSVEPTSTINQ